MQAIFTCVDYSVTWLTGGCQPSELLPVGIRPRAHQMRQQVVPVTKEYYDGLDTSINRSILTKGPSSNLANPLVYKRKVTPKIERKNLYN